MPLARKLWEVRRCESADEMRTLAIADWQKLGSAARNQAAWELVKEWWATNKGDPSALSLQKTMVTMTRRL
jgi:hypothetical protein